MSREAFLDSEARTQAHAISFEQTEVPVPLKIRWTQSLWRTSVTALMGMSLQNKNGAARLSPILICLVASLALLGCDNGPEYYPVSGTVVFKQDGSAAQFGSIEFRSKTETPVIARGKIAKDGTFRVSASGKDGTIGGKHTVVILQVVGSPRSPQSENVAHDHGLEVAKKYSDHRTTDLELNVTADSATGIVLEVDSNDVH